MKKQNKRGFTLIELIVVISIIGILSAILVPNLIKYIDDSKITAAKQDATLIEKRVEMMLISENDYVEIKTCGSAGDVLCKVRVDLVDPYTGQLSAIVTDGNQLFVDTALGQTVDQANEQAVLSVIASLNKVAKTSILPVKITTENTVPTGDYVNRADFTKLSVGDYLYSYHKDGILVLMQFNVE